ncbi:MAG: diacylglycerol kinase family lipid kinase [Lysobacterales bacterium]|jgi:diacylglycerol kinase (ATP)
MKLLLVFNPVAAAGRSARLMPRVQDALGRVAEVDTLVTEVPHQGARLLATVDLTPYDGVVVAGGDGSLFDAVNGLCARAAADRVPLGVVPVGTGNAFARDLGLRPGDWQRAVELIGRQQRRRVDVGRVDTSRETWHFLNIVGTGLPVAAMNTAHRLKWFGRSAYTLAVLYHILHLKSYPLHIEIDGKHIEQEALFVEVSNTRYTGTSFLIAPQAKFDDGLFDVTFVRRMSRARLLRLFPTIYRGEHLRFEEVSTFRGRQVRILAPRGLALAPDGEIRGSLPATVSCLAGELEVFG